MVSPFCFPLLFPFSLCPSTLSAVDGSFFLSLSLSVSLLGNFIPPNDVLAAAAAAAAAREE
jgi:hypothetical protein